MEQWKKLFQSNANAFLTFSIQLISGPDVQTARGRLTGALKVAVAPPSEDDEATDPSLPGKLSIYL